MYCLKKSQDTAASKIVEILTVTYRIRHYYRAIMRFLGVSLHRGIEANANKHVTVVISEGKELVIKKLPQQDDLADNEG